MTIFQETFKIVNNSSYTLYLDTKDSQKLGDGAWPKTVEPKSTSAPFNQTGHKDVNPTAVYNLQGSNPPINAYLHFYLWGIDPAVHVNMTLDFGGTVSLFVGSSISENNTHGTSWETKTAPKDGATKLNIDSTGNGKTYGDATFTIGAG